MGVVAKNLLFEFFLNFYYILLLDYTYVHICYLASYVSGCIYNIKQRFAYVPQVCGIRTSFEALKKNTHYMKEKIKNKANHFTTEC